MRKKARIIFAGRTDPRSDKIMVTPRASKVKRRKAPVSVLPRHDVFPVTDRGGSSVPRIIIGEKSHCTH